MTGAVAALVGMRQAGLQSVTVADIFGIESDTVAPYDSSRTVTATANPQIVGPYDSISYTRLSGAVMSNSGNDFFATVPANSSRVATWRCTVSRDGQTATDDFTVNLRFNSGRA